MVSERLPWCFRTRNADGGERWYWKRRGHKSVRLPDDAAARLARVQALNAAAAGGAASPRVEGSIAWCIAQYRRSAAFRDRAAGTREVYGRWLDWLEREIGAAAAAEVTRKGVMRMRAGLAERHGRASVLHACAVLRIVLEVARDHGLIEHNPATRMRLASPPARRQVWTGQEIDAVVAAAPAPIALAVRLLLYTAQRPSDVVRMAWSAYDAHSGLISLRQVKTGTLIDVPAHQALRAALDAARRRGPLIATQRTGGAWTVPGLRQAIHRAMRAAGVDPRRLQVRDLRRTAVVRLAEAGATVPQIAAVTGHSLATAEQIVAAYLPRTTEAARGAVVKWERKGK